MRPIPQIGLKPDRFANHVALPETTRLTMAMTSGTVLRERTASGVTEALGMRPQRFGVDALEQAQAFRCWLVRKPNGEMSRSGLVEAAIVRR